MKDLSLYILDLVQNSLRAEASKVTIEVSQDHEWLTLKILDNGKGMSQEQLKEATNPFMTTRKTRHVGLGLALIKAHCELCQGTLTLDSTLGQGTVLKATFQMSHIDAPPFGNLAETLITLIIIAPQVDFLYRHCIEEKQFVFDTVQIKSMLEDLSIQNATVIKWLRTYLKSAIGE